MSTIPFKLKDCTAFIDGLAYTGREMEMTPPALKFKMEDHRGGGMDGPVGIEMGIERLDFKLTLSEFTPDIMGVIGRIEADQSQIVFRGSQERGALARSVVCTMRGGFYSHDMGAMKPGGDGGSLTLEGTGSYYRYEIDGRVLTEIDLLNSVRIINGEDQLAARRAALGL